MSKFQVVLLGFFGFFIIVAVMVFAMYRGGSQGQATVTLWGDLPQNFFDQFLNESGLNQDQSLIIRYLEKPAASIEEELTEALAEGKGPDLVMITQDKFWENKSKLVPIPYESISERDFADTFVEEGELFLTPEGIYALPLSVDPMVLYYNRDLLTANNFTNPVGYWDELYVAASALRKVDGAGNLTKSAIALGETKNIPHFKEILSLLMLQAGSPVTGYINNELRSLLFATLDFPVAPGQAALDFYAQFSNPTKAYYSWNKVLQPAQTRFASGDTAYYLGFASELATLRNKNPTLNFSVASVPQSRVSGKTASFGLLRGVALTRGTRNSAAALNAALKLISRENAARLSAATGIPPARRDLLSVRPTDSITPVFYRSALQSRGWIDPNDEESRKIFSALIEAVTSGRARSLEALREADRKLEDLIK